MDYTTPYPAPLQPRLTGAGGWAPLPAAPQPEAEAEAEEATVAWDPCLLSYPGQVDACVVWDGWERLPGKAACHPSHQALCPTTGDPTSPALPPLSSPAGQSRACHSCQPHCTAAGGYARQGIHPPRPAHRRCGGTAGGSRGGSRGGITCPCTPAATQPVCHAAPQRQPAGPGTAQPAGRRPCPACGSVQRLPRPAAGLWAGSSRRLDQHVRQLDCCASECMTAAVAERPLSQAACQCSLFICYNYLIRPLVATSSLKKRHVT